MSDLVQYNAGFAFSQEQIALIKNTIAKGATDDELKLFTSIAQKYGLDPFIKEIWFIKQAKKEKDKTGNWNYKKLPNGDIDYSGADTLIYTSRDGYLKIAQRDEDNFVGIISFAVCEGDVFEVDAENYKVTHKFGAKRGKIIGAWAKVDHKKRKPVIVFAPFSEYYTEKSTTWKQYPTAMIIKIAEVLALKRQFGISGLVTKEEMSHQIREDEPEPENIIEIVTTETTTEDIPKISTEQAKQLFKEAGDNIATVKQILAKYGYENSKDVTLADYESILSEIKFEAKAS